MKTTPSRPAFLIAALVLAGCLGVPVAPLGTIVSIYATKSDAEAVASGQFSAIPIALAGEGDIELVLLEPCAQKTTEGRSRDGHQGCASVDSLPRRLLNSPRC